MSIDAMNHVWDIPSFKGSEKLVMLCLADHADESGFCWPAINTIARKSGLSPTTVKSALKKLEAGGWLFKKNQFEKTDTGRLVRSNNHYQLPLKLLKKKADEQTNERRGVGQIPVWGRSVSGYKPPIDPPIEPSSKDLAPSETLEAEPVLFEIPLNRKGLFHGVTQLDIDRYSDLFGAVNVRAELKKMIGWCYANPRKRKTKQGIEKFIQGWLGREQDKGRYLSPKQTNASVDMQDEVTVIQREVALLESSINSEKKRMLYLIDAKRPQHEVDPSMRKIADLSAKCRDLLERVANLEAV